jgi:hypothetical protein
MQEAASFDHPIKTIELLAQIIPLKQLQDAIHTDHPHHIDRKT